MSDESPTSVVHFAQEDALGVLTVDNPPLNLMSGAVIAGFEDAITAVEAAPIRALLIRTEGPHFMAGADVRVFHERSAADARALFSRMLPVLARLEGLPVLRVVGWLSRRVIWSCA